MKGIFLLTLFITIGFACQQNIYKTPNPIHPSIRDANKLGIDDKSNQETFMFYGGGYSGVLLKIPNGTIEKIEGDSAYVSSFYIDATEVCNLHYRRFIQWNHRIWASMPQVAISLLPDTTIWLEQFPNEAIGGLLKNHYFRNPAFDYHPVVGVSWEQAQAYALWRTDRINEAILVYRGHIQSDPEGYEGQNSFDTYNFLNAYFETSSGDKPMVDPITKNERRVTAADDILLPNYRLPTSSELEHAATQVKDYSKNKALEAFKKKILAHNKIYPIPTYYDHKQYNLPYCIMEEGIKDAPYHLIDNVDEWTQQSYNTNEQYNMHYHAYDADNKPHYYVPIWIKRAAGTVDTNIVNKFAQQHTIKDVSHYKGFRCVMPNLW